jgi:uncharacterized NAD(P)/FAD-binding protein YdhS
MPPIPEHDIAILGAGFSGSLLAAHLAQRRGGPDGILLIERAAEAGPGIAYGTADPLHLLNVPAKAMSAWPDAPAHFLDWARARPAAAFGPLCDGAAPDAFVPRALYGAYCRDILRGAGLAPLQAEVTGLVRQDGAWRIEAAAGPVARARRAVLATGNPPPARRNTATFRGDPWAEGALDGIPPEAPVLLVGAGLTMVDTVLSLRLGRSHRGPIHAISRHGWTPLAHPAPPLPWPRDFVLPKPGAAPRAVLRAVREEATQAAIEGVPWQAVTDALRPVSQALWCAWPEAERARFLRHLRTLWNLHRHRVAPRAHAELARAAAEGQFRLRAARLLGHEPEGEGTVARLRLRGGAETTLPVARILLCTGPGSGSGSGEEWLQAPPLAQLRDAGLIATDAFALGIECDPDRLQVLDAEGRPVPGLHLLGPITRGRLWEATAVPELRVQAARLAEMLAAQSPADL